MMNWIFHYTYIDICFSASTAIYWCTNFTVAHFSSSPLFLLCLMPLFFYWIYHYFETATVFFLCVITVMHVELLTVGRHKNIYMYYVRATKLFGLILFSFVYSLIRWMHERLIYLHWVDCVHQKMMNFAREIVLISICYTWYIAKPHLYVREMKCVVTLSLCLVRLHRNHHASVLVFIVVQQSSYKPTFMVLIWKMFRFNSFEVELIILFLASINRISHVLRFLKLSIHKTIKC